MPTKIKPKLGSTSFARVETFEFTTAQREILNTFLVQKNRKKWPEKWPDGFVAGLELVYAELQAVSRTEEEGSKPSEVAAGLDLLQTKTQELSELLNSGSASLGVEVHDAIILGAAKAHLAYHKHTCGESWTDLKQKLLAYLDKTVDYVTAARSGMEDPETGVVRRGRRRDWAKVFLDQRVENLFAEYGFEAGAAEGAPYHEVVGFLNQLWKKNPDCGPGRLTRRRKKSPQT